MTRRTANSRTREPFLGQTEGSLGNADAELLQPQPARQLAVATPASRLQSVYDWPHPILQLLFQLFDALEVSDYLASTGLGSLQSLAFGRGASPPSHYAPPRRATCESERVQSLV